MAEVTTQDPELEDAGDDDVPLLAALILIGAVYVVDGARAVWRRLRLWPAPSAPLGCLTNDDIDRLPPAGRNA